MHKKVCFDYLDNKVWKKFTLVYHINKSKILGDIINFIIKNKYEGIFKLTENNEIVKIN